MPEAWSPVLVVSVAVAVFLMGFSKTAMPVSGILAGPVLAAALTPTVAAGFAVPLLVLGDLFGLALYRQHADWGLIRRLIPGVLVGFAFTALLFRFVETGLLARILGVLIFVSVVLEVRRLRGDSGRDSGHDSGSDSGQAAMTNKAAIAFYGTLAGMTSMAANAGGAAMSVYLVKMRVSMLAFMGTSVWFFFILNLIKVPFVLGLGFIDAESLIANLWYTPVLVAGAGVGALAFRGMNAAVFTRIALGLSVLASLWLIVKG
jgi:uncharacterized membrane protein YfcA